MNKKSEKNLPVYGIGPVIVFGITSSSIVGLIYFILTR